VPGVPVELLSDGGEVRRADTDANGHYGFAAAPRGGLRVRAAGPEGPEVAVEASPGSVAEAPLLELP
jgi:hypothetical protein